MTAPEVSPWRLSWRADPDVAAIADRHYNRQKIGAAQFVPPGRCAVFKVGSWPAVAAWVTSWPLPAYVQHQWAGAWLNQLFRNESSHLSSELIVAAVAHTRDKWPDVPALGMVTFVDASKVRQKRDPGYCYLRAGFRHVGFTAGGLHAFQMLPRDMPPPVAVPGAQRSLFDLEAS